MKEYNYCPICAIPLQMGMVEGRKRKYCPKCNFVDYKNPLPVALAVAVKDKKVLLIKRGVPPVKGMWASPSGFIEIGETPEEGCLRELEEETGVSGEIVKLIGVLRIEDKEIYGDMLIIAYLVNVKDGELTPGDEVEDARFFDIADLPGYYAPLLKNIITEIQGKEIF
ncbi:MAG: NUDIX hydrolase [Chloroflexi bacterium CG_4_10_14_0_8_um_filter_46_9]|jgi:ADP-ribose pyrophosphatase YjhB (NUDIX family)|nr:MAG: NUDIX hydrolase [Chloroflexi bacterium CG_4_10_14_0_8_um_filter_46_9]